MLIQYVEREFYSVQLEELDLEYICEFYNTINRKSIVLMVYDGEDYYTNITYEEISRYSEEKELTYFLKYICKSEKYIKVTDNQSAEAERIFTNNPDFVFLFLKDSEKNGKAVFISYKDITQEYLKVLEDTQCLLRDKHINSFLVGVPNKKDIIVEKRHSEWKGWGFCDKINWTVYNRGEMEKHLYRFTDRNYDLARKDMLGVKMHKAHYGREDRTIFVVGPCIVAGFENFMGESLGDILYEKLQQQRLPYQVECVFSPANIKAKLSNILEYDIRENDIVLLITDFRGGG